jgi:hypothetical protein
VESIIVNSYKFVLSFSYLFISTCRAFNGLTGKSETGVHGSFSLFEKQLLQICPNAFEVLESIDHSEKLHF